LQWTSLIQVVSDVAGDSRTVTISGRDRTGNDVEETLSLQGTTVVSGVTEFLKVDGIVASATHGTATITVIQHLGQRVLHEIGPGETTAFRMFRNATASGSEVSRYEKLFWKNTDDSDEP